MFDAFCTSGSSPTESGADYHDPDIYRPEVNKALARTKRLLLNKGAELKEGPRISDEGPKDFEDLCQIVDVEIWKATKKYVDKMNKALAYTIASNQAARFLKLRLQEQTLLVVEDGNGHTDLLDEYKLPKGEPAGDPFLDKFGQAQRVPRFCSLNEDRSNSEGEAMPSRAEEEVNVRPVAEYLERSRLGTGELRLLVDGWHGTKRGVGEALLANPDVSVRHIPGVPKSTASRLKQVVLKEFREFLEQPGQKQFQGAYT